MRKVIGAGTFVAGLLVPAFVHPLSLGIIISGVVCMLGVFIYFSGMSEEDQRRSRRLGLGALSLRQITLVIVLMCVFILALFVLVLGIPSTAIPFFAALCAAWIALMYWVNITNRKDSENA